MRSKVMARPKSRCNRHTSRALVLQRGQGVVEYVLMLVIVLGLSRVTIQSLKQMNFIQTLMFSPWERLDGMIQCGVWKSCGTKKPSPDLHPESQPRATTLLPKY